MAMAGPSLKSTPSDSMLSTRDRCLQEISSIESEIRSGNPDLAGLILALRDWRTELMILKASGIPELDLDSATLPWAR